MDWNEIGLAIKCISYLWKLDKWSNKFVYLFHRYCCKPCRVIVFGTSGSGKTEFLRAITGKEVQETEPNRTNLYVTNKLYLPNGDKILFYDAPGDMTLKNEREKLQKLIANNKIDGIINIVTYGYNDAKEAKDVPVFKTGSEIGEVKDDYLRINRANELAQLEEWKDRINSDNGIKWIITVINKADIWHSQEDEVVSYYEKGNYYENFTKLIQRVCHTHVSKYCSLISPFGKKPMVLTFSERDKIRLHNALLKELIEIINERK